MGSGNRGDYSAYRFPNDFIDIVREHRFGYFEVTPLNETDVYAMNRSWEERCKTASSYIRHTFAGNVLDVTTDYKVTSDMMGHSTGRSVTARYTKRTKSEALKEVANQMNLDYIDLDRLEARAIDFFRKPTSQDYVLAIIHYATGKVLSVETENQKQNHLHKSIYRPMLT